MRVATLQSFNSGLNSILDNQSSVNKTQQQVSSGRRVLTPADDPIASTKILQLQQDIAQRDQYDRNMTAAENRLTRRSDFIVDNRQPNAATRTHR